MTDEQFAKFARFEPFGIEVTRKEWGVLLHNADPNGVSGPLDVAVEVHDDNTVTLWCEVDADATPESLRDSTRTAYVEPLDRYIESTCENLMSDELDIEDGSLRNLVEYMMEQGWKVCRAVGDGRITHNDDPSKSFGTWSEAIKACISVASEF